MMSAIEVWGWALVHFVWQGAAVAALLALGLTVTDRLRPRLRYAMSVGALALMAVLPLITALHLRPTHTEARRPVTPEVERTEPGQVLSGPAYLARSSTKRAEGPAELPVASGGSSERAAQPEGSVVGSTGLAVRVRQALRPALGWLVALWLAGVVVLSIRLAGGFTRVRRLTRRGTRPVGAATRATFERLIEELGIGRSVRLLESTLVRVPSVIGWLRPVVLLPGSALTGLTPAQLEVLIAHELAHIRRHDYLVNVVQSAVETLLFYHPAVWWVSNRIREEREACCDDLVVRVCGDVHLYAGALLEVGMRGGESPSLAPAAAGGSLLRRVQRLVGSEPSRGESFPRWLAGFLATAAALLIVGGAQLIRTEPSVAAPSVTDRPEVETENAVTAASYDAVTNDVEDGTGWSDRARDEGIAGQGQQRDSVILYRGDEAFAERWAWAEEVAREGGLDRYWIGYAIDDHPRIEGWIYFDRFTAIVMNGGRISGVSLGNISGTSVRGTRLSTLVGARPPDDVAVLLGYAGRDGSAAELARVRASSYLLPVDLEGRVLIWLGDASDGESIGRLESLYGATSSKKLRENLVGLVGIHGDTDAALPVLAAWIEGAEPDAIREEATEWLGYHPQPRSLALLARTARNDRSGDVREEAAEAVGDLDMAAATDTLIVLARTLRHSDAREEAVEALGQKRGDRAIEALAEIARTDPSEDIQAEAVETLGELGEVALPQILEIARTHPRIGVREEAVETLAEAAPPERAQEVLRDIIWNDPHPDVQDEAVQALSELKGVSSVDLLVEVAERHPNTNVQEEAVEALAESTPTDQAIGILARLARTHSRQDVQREAVEALGDLHDTRALEPLADIARSHPRPDVRREAVETYAELAIPDEAVRFLVAVANDDPHPDVQEEAVDALGEFHGEAALTALTEIAEGHPNPDVQEEAIDAIAEIASPSAALEILSRIASSHPREDVQREAVEEMGELQIPEVRTKLLAIARSHARLEVREEAIETYADLPPSAETAEVLAQLVRDDPQEDIRFEALDALAELEDGSGIPLLIEIARTHPDKATRLEAIDELGDSHDPRAEQALQRLLQGG